MHDLPEEIRRTAVSVGADLVGFAPISRLNNAPAELHPRAIEPQVPTVIAVAVRQRHVLSRAPRRAPTARRTTATGTWYLNEVVAPPILREVVLRREDEGHTSIPVRGPFHARSGRRIREDQAAGPDGLVSLSVIGVAAGLSELGHSKVFLTPQFGPRQRVYAILTDA